MPSRRRRCADAYSARPSASTCWLRRTRGSSRSTASSRALRSSSGRARSDWPSTRAGRRRRRRGRTRSQGARSPAHRRHRRRRPRRPRSPRSHRSRSAARGRPEVASGVLLAPGPGPDLPIVHDRLHPEAVPLDLEQPRRIVEGRARERGQHRLDEVGHAVGCHGGSLAPIRSCGRGQAIFVARSSSSLARYARVRHPSGGSSGRHRGGRP